MAANHVGRRRTSFVDCAGDDVAVKVEQSGRLDVAFGHPWLRCRHDVVLSRILNQKVCRDGTALNQAEYKALRTGPDAPVSSSRRLVVIEGPAYLGGDSLDFLDSACG